MPGTFMKYVRDAGKMCRNAANAPGEHRSGGRGIRRQTKDRRRADAIVVTATK